MAGFAWAGVPSFQGVGQDPNSSFANTLDQMGNPGLGGPGQQTPGLPDSLNAPGPQPGPAQTQGQQPPGVASLLQAFNKGGGSGAGDAAQGAAAAGQGATSWMDKAMPWLMALQALGGQPPQLGIGRGGGVSIPNGGAGL